VYIQARFNVETCSVHFVLRILQISSAQSLGGGERHLADLANGLVARGHVVHVALRPRSSLIAELKSVSRKNVITLPLRNSLDVKSARELSRLVSKNNIQIVHAHMARDYPLAAYAVRGNPRSRLIDAPCSVPLESAAPDNAFEGGARYRGVSGSRLTASGR